MLPYAKVETAEAFPNACIACRRNDGPFVNTQTVLHVSSPGGLRPHRVYLCERCVEWCMQALSLDAEAKELRAELARVQTENEVLVAERTEREMLIADAVRRSKKPKPIAA